MRRAEAPGSRVALWCLSGFFVAVGLAHFFAAPFFVRIMPPWLPWHAELVGLSGAFEIIGGVAVLVPRLRRPAGVGLLLLLVAVFPANVHMAMHPELFSEFPVVGLYLRLPLQLAMLAWVWRSTLASPGWLSTRS